MKTLIRSILGMFTLLAVAWPSTATPASAQYFGRNKVQYEDFDFQVLRTEHFDIYFYPEEEAATREAARMAERWYARLSSLLDYQFEQRQPLILYASHPHFQQTTALSGSIGEGTGGVTEAFKQRVILPFSYSMEETDHVLGHELVHAFQYDISGVGRAGAGLEGAARRFAVPGWFVEGMAEYLSVGPVDALTAIWLRNAALSGKIPTVEQLGNDPSIFPYRYGHALWAYIGGRWGDGAIAQILKMTGEGVPYAEAFQRILNVDLDELSGDWHTAIRRTYLPQLATRVEAREEADALITEERKGGRINLAPAISPDGKWVAFLSELDFIDVQLHLANAETGEVVRTLQKGTAFDSHFASLRYIQSAGTWSPDSRRFAFAALKNSQDRLVVVDVNDGNRLQEFVVDGVSEISNPTWSPDGSTIVFSGLAGGISDLYALNVASGESRKLTDDMYADMQPSFSPDGRRLAWVTDRFGTDLEALDYGGYRLAVMNVATGRSEPVPGMAGSHNLNPQWSAEGDQLVFISNRNGIPNIYRVTLATGEVAQITDLFSGVSGITDVSPALTMSADGTRLLFTAFEQDGYNIYSITDPTVLAGNPVILDEETSPEVPAMLPPTPRPTESAFNRVATTLADVSTGLPSESTALAYEVSRYHPRLGLDYLGQPTVGATVGGLYGGVGLYGSVSGIFSDLLGRHTLGAALQAQGQLDEVGGAVQYLNTASRLNWGVGLRRIPYVYGYYNAGFSGGQYVQQVVRYRYFDTGAELFAQYPISRVQRVEAGGGFRRIAQDMQIFDINSFGERVDRQESDGFGYNMFEASAAWVYDSSIFGFTGPISGQRARVEVTPVVGQLQFVSATADFRKYLYMKPATLAFRGLHYGRYGQDSEGVFADQYLGYNNLLRGYGSMYDNCVSAGVDCEQLNSLFGSRVAVANAELRVPLLQPSLSGGGLQLPVDAIAFFDAGVAWNSGSAPVLATGVQPDAASRGLLTSAGVGARVNLFGSLIFEVDYVKAFQSAVNGGQWVFVLQPGF